jgi:hypothetical protein
VIPWLGIRSRCNCHDVLCLIDHRGVGVL